MPSWEHFPHEADIGVRGQGDSPEVAFEQAALGLTAVITDPSLVRANEQVAINCEAPSLDVLFVDWLNALIYEMTTRSMLFGRFRVKIDGLRLSAEAEGESVDRQRHEPVVEPKGATFTELRVSRNDEGQWVAQCVVDV
ncbi:MAG: archease [Myxococcales bacterium]|nr:archease [Myxococcales bacterium]MDH3483041.1 archease [Myxococcales bacterium]